MDSNTLHYMEFFIGSASSSLPEDTLEALCLFAKSSIDADRLIIHSFQLDQIVEAFDVAERKEAVKISVDIGGNGDDVL